MTLEQGDEDLVRQYQSGNARAFDALVERHRAFAYRLGRRLLGNHHTAEDASQDAFLRACTGLPNFRFECPFRVWFTRILVNVCRSRRRSMRRPPEIEAEPAADPEVAPVEMTEFQKRLDAAIQRLPEKQRLTLILRVQENHDFSRIAEILGTTDDAARMNLSLARKALRETLGPFLAEAMP